LAGRTLEIAEAQATVIEEASDFNQATADREVNKWPPILPRTSQENKETETATNKKARTTIHARDPATHETDHKMASPRQVATETTARTVASHGHTREDNATAPHKDKYHYTSVCCAEPQRGNQVNSRDNRQPNGQNQHHDVDNLSVHSVDVNKIKVEQSFNARPTNTNESIARHNETVHTDVTAKPTIKAKSHPQVTITIEGIQVKMAIDSCSSANIIDEPT
jgi:hypothetical protein